MNTAEKMYNNNFMSWNRELILIDEEQVLCEYHHTTCAVWGICLNFEKRQHIP